MKPRYLKVWAPGHPLSVGRGEVLEHRRVLYDAIGPGEHPCYWCGEMVAWTVRARASSARGTLVVDHLDGDPRNNARVNLVPACHACNVRAGFNPHRVADDEAHTVRPSSGTRLRGIPKVCAQCAAPFVTPFSADGTFCSRACGDASRRLDVCRRGHPRSGDNLSAKGQCKECMRIASVKHNDKRRAARQARRAAG